ncbi:hypothetical protein CENSYa_1901 [Cenarchaeum symbiosum A]|uniref:Glycosyltransferase n=1 Tax=Cenarchaeum symbiosum (strain A) TaxID=414004 RepID=A0RYU3_CENSY|nr:hypothetical protein CENSYa_1901 [Cenarchaeum symbiosum A]
MRLNRSLRERLGDVEIHLSSKSPIYERLLEEFPAEKERIHEVLMPTPIDGRFGPSVPRSMANILLPVDSSPPLVRQVVDYLREERRLYNEEKFDLVINDGDMGSNILASNRSVPSLFVTNQYMPRLWLSRSYFYPSMAFVARQIAKASRILVADSAPPYTMCEYNLNFPDKVAEKVSYVGHFTSGGKVSPGEKSDLEKLIEGADYGYWMRTGNRSTNDGTGERYERAFASPEMSGERRIVSHARNDPSIDAVAGRDGRRYSISEAYEKKVDWIQIDVGFLSEQEKNSVIEGCKYAVVNGSHTVMGEIMGGKARPIIGIPVYDEHTNQIRWAEEKGLGVLAGSTKSVLAGIVRIRGDYARFEEALADFAANFDGGGASNTAEIAAGILEDGA